MLIKPRGLGRAILRNLVEGNSPKPYAKSRPHHRPSQESRKSVIPSSPMCPQKSASADSFRPSSANVPPSRGGKTCLSNRQTRYDIRDTVIARRPHLFKTGPTSPDRCSASRVPSVAPSSLGHLRPSLVQDDFRSGDYQIALYFTSFIQLSGGSPQMRRLLHLLSYSF